MEILIKPKKVQSLEFWENKMQGVVLVEKEEDIEPLFKLLCEQDDYWEDYKELIKVAPKEINDQRDLERMCEYTGKTDIFKPQELMEKIPFILFQYKEEEYD